MKYQMTCTCGDKFPPEAKEYGSREEAVADVKAMMNEDAISAHWAERHPGDSNKPSMDQAHAMIESSMQEVA